MGSFTVGKEVLSYCSSCKLSLAHIIVSMKDPNTIAKVQCRTCQSTQKYKDPAMQGKKVKTKSIIPGAKSKSVPISVLWEEELGKSQGKARNYNIREIFAIGDLVNHKKFGPGIVQEIKDSKIEVLFQHEIKTLVHGMK